jgi:hypothetical protein
MDHPDRGPSGGGARVWASFDCFVGPWHAGVRERAPPPWPPPGRGCLRGPPARTSPPDGLARGTGPSHGPRSRASRSRRLRVAGTGKESTRGRRARPSTALPRRGAPSRLSSLSALHRQRSLADLGRQHIHDGTGAPGAAKGHHRALERAHLPEAAASLLRDLGGRPVSPLLPPGHGPAVGPLRGDHRADPARGGRRRSRPASGQAPCRPALGGDGGPVLPWGEISPRGDVRLGGHSRPCAAGGVGATTSRRAWPARC